MPSHQTSSGVELLRAAVDALVGTELTPLNGVEVCALIAEIEVQKRRLEAVDQVLLAEVLERGLAGDYAATSPVDLLVTRLRVTPAEARARVNRARDLGPRRALTGGPLSPHLPAVSAAVRDGRISTRHVDVITGCLARVTVVAPEACPVAERLLLEAAQHEHPGQLATTAQFLLDRLDPDGRPPKDDEIERRREFTLAKRSDGSSVPKGSLTAELTEMWETIFDSLAAPVPAADGMPDDRSPGQRRHDALAEAAARLLRSKTLPAAGGAPVTVLARTSMTELAQGTGVAVTGHGSVLPVSRLLELAADAQVIPVICTDTGGILAYGRGRRLASTKQRLALAARDGGCSFPGCTRPAAWTEVHHIRPWNDGGTTDLDNMCLACRYHHREFARRGWDVTVSDGVPMWLPPPWIDPERKPIRNTAHHLTDFDFTIEGVA